MIKTAFSIAIIQIKGFNAGYPGYRIWVNIRIRYILYLKLTDFLMYFKGRPITTIKSIFMKI